MQQRPTEAASEEAMEDWEAPAVTEYSIADVTEVGPALLNFDGGTYS